MVFSKSYHFITYWDLKDIEVFLLSFVLFKRWVHAVADDGRNQLTEQTTDWKVCQTWISEVE